MTIDLYLGVDPGRHGGLVSLSSTGKLGCLPMPDDNREVWNWLLDQVGQDPNGAVYGAVEQQMPRPTTWFDRATRKWQSSILRSTCILYGNYCACRALLVAAEVSLDEPTPQRWHRELGIAPREKGTKDAAWKNVLKAHAQRLFPKARVTLAVADAILLAEYCRRLRRRVT